MTTTSEPIGDSEAGEQFTRALLSALHSRDRAVGALQRWEPGRVDTRVLRLTAATPDPVAAAWTGKLFAQWHSGRSGVFNGPEGRGLGAALGELGEAGARGANNPSAERLLQRLVSAGTDQAMTLAVGAAARGLRASKFPPRCAVVFDELQRWRNPHERSIVQQQWAADFYAPPRRQASTPA